MSDVIVDNDTWDGEHKPTVYIDFLGQECRVGDHIAYATSSSHSANVVVGTVLEFKTVNAQGEQYGQTRYDYNSPIVKGQPRPSWFEYKWCLKVQPLLDSRFSRGDYKTGLKKSVVIGTVMNVHKVDVSRATIEVYEDE